MFLEDCRANSWSLRPCCMVLAYRIAHFCSVWRKKNVLNNIWAAPVLRCTASSPNAFLAMKFRPLPPLAAASTIHHGYAVVIKTSSSSRVMISPFATG